MNHGDPCPVCDQRPATHRTIRRDALRLCADCWAVMIEDVKRLRRRDAV